MEQFLTINRGKTSRKNCVPKFGPNRSKSGPKLRFFYFLKFGSLDFFIITLDGSLEQYLATSRGRTCKKIWWLKFWSNRPKSGPTLGFLSFFFKLAPLVLTENA